MNKHSIRFRISAAFLVIGALLSTVFATALWLIAEVMEDRYVEVTLVDNLNMVIENRKMNRQAPLPHSTAIRGYAFARDGSEPVPDFLTGLGPGIHERQQGATVLQIAVGDDDGTRYALTYNGTPLERLENELILGLVLGVFLFTYASVWLGFWASGRVVEPVKQLADKVQELGDRTENIALSGEWGDDEVGDLARAFEQYSARIRQFIERETAFTSDVSHELRNPIMSASSAVELLLDRNDLAPAARQQLLRLQRSMARMADLVEVFLTLARESGNSDPAAAGRFGVEEIIREIIARQQETAARKNLEFDFEVRGRPSVSLRTAGSIVLENLIGNAVLHTSSGVISIVLDEHSITVTDSGPGISNEDASRIFDRSFSGKSAPPGCHGLGLSIVHRLCERIGWRVEISNNPDGGTIARLAIRE